MKSPLMLRWLLSLAIAARCLAAAVPPPTGNVDLASLLAPGTQLVFHGASANVGNGQALFPDGKGKWKRRDTGENETVVDFPASGVEFYSLVTVVAVVGNEAILDERKLLVDALTRGVIHPDGFPGSVGHRMAVDQSIENYFMLPAALRDLKGNDDLEIVRGPYTLNGEIHDAVTLTFRSAKKNSFSVFDAATGLRLRYYVANAGNNQRVPAGDNGTGGLKVDVKELGSSLMYADLVAVRNPRYPWAAMPQPAWVRRGEKLAYTGSGGTMGFAVPMQLSLGIVDSADNWASFEQTLSFVPAVPGVQINGSPSFGGPWLPPAGLAGLVRGQVIDRIPGPDLTISVQQVSADAITFEMAGGDLNSSYRYSLRSGALLAFEHQTRTAAGQVARFSFTLNGGDKPAAIASTRSTPPPSPANAETRRYEDTVARLSIEVVKGWSATAASGRAGLEIRKGDSSILIDQSEGAKSGAQVADFLKKQFEQQYRQFQPTSGDNVTISNRAARTERFTGISPLNKPYHVTVVGIDPAPNRPALGVIILCPDSSLGDLPEINRMMRTLQLLP